jgi:hypothetical protein
MSGQHPRILSELAAIRARRGDAAEARFRLRSRSEMVVGERADTLRRVARAAWSAPATWCLALCITLLAAWDARVLTLLRPGGPWLGPAFMAAVWVLLYSMLILAYGSLEHAPAGTARRLSLRLGIALVLALVSTEVARIAVNPLLRPLNWTYYHYLRLLLAPMLAAFWCAAILPGETRALARTIRREEAIAPVVALVALLLLAAVLTAASDLAFQLVGVGSTVEQQLSRDLVDPRSWASMTVILFAVLAIVFAVTSSATTAALLVSPIYATMVFASLVKIRYIHSAVQPLDLLALPEFMPLFGSFFGAGAIVVSAIGIVLWLVALVATWRRWRTPMSIGRRGVIGLVSAVLLVTFVGAFLPPALLPGPIAARSETLRAFTMKIGAPAGNFREEARAHGIMLNFLSELRSAFITVPRGYSAARVEHAMRPYVSREATPAPAKHPGGVSLVIYLVESLMDPNDLGLHYTAEPMPNFRAIAAEQIHGRAIVPQEFSGSANTEFELLTGMSNAFLPSGSIPYRQYVRRPMPALPRLLRDLGYATTAVQADYRYYYDRERVYPLLGFEHAAWLHDPVREHADRGAWPSDESIVNAVIEASQRSRPFFVFAFPSSSHSPYDYGTYARSDLDVLDAPAPAASEVKEYINAVRVTDRAIGRLVEHFRARSDSTIIVIMGDHLPPFSSAVLSPFLQRLSRLPAAQRARAARATPLLVWANFTLPRGELTLSTNMVPAYLLERLGARPRSIFAVTDSLSRTLPVVSAVVQATDGRLWPQADVPAALRGPIDDYRLLQYDLLLGDRFALRKR